MILLRWGGRTSPVIYGHGPRSALFCQELIHEIMTMQSLRWMMAGMKLLERVVMVCQRKRYSPNTAKAYRWWVEDYLRFHKNESGRWVHPRNLDATHLEQYLNHLARQRKVAGSTQNQALNAIVFLYRQVLGDELGDDHLGKFSAERAKRPKRLPTVLSVGDVGRLFAAMPLDEGQFGLMARLQYGAGLRRLRDPPEKVSDPACRRGQAVVWPVPATSGRTQWFPPWAAKA